MRGPPELGPIVGESMAIRRACELIERYAPTNLSILLVGATGTGKELLARQIHARSGRPGRFVGVNCGVLPRDMADGLLFGYDRGAFSGAVKRHRGHVECSDGGTLFLDELLSLSQEGQAKLLRALDTGEVQRLGEELELYVDLRVVGAVQEDVEDRMTRGELRRDLYRRVAGVVIELPALADRPEDVIPLARHFALEQGRVLEAGAASVLAHHSWPGNVRELRDAIRRAGCLVNNGSLPPQALREAIALGAPNLGCRAATPEQPVFATFTREGLVALCDSFGWKAERIATHLGMGRTVFFQELRGAGLTLRGLRKSATYASVRERSRTHADARGPSRSS